MNKSLLSHMTFIQFAPCAAASTTSLWIVSRYRLSMTIPLKMLTGVEAGPVSSNRCFVVASWIFLFSRSCSHNVMMVCSLFSVADKAALWAGCGLERITLWLTYSTVRDVLVELSV